MTTPRGNSSGGIFFSVLNRWVMVCAVYPHRQLYIPYHSSHYSWVNVHTAMFIVLRAPSVTHILAGLDLKTYLHSPHSHACMERPRGSEEGSLNLSHRRRRRLLECSLPQGLHTQHLCRVHHASSALGIKRGEW